MLILVKIRFELAQISIWMIRPFAGSFRDEIPLVRDRRGIDSLASGDSYSLDTKITCGYAHLCHEQDANNPRSERMSIPDLPGGFLLFNICLYPACRSRHSGRLARL